MKHEIMFSVDGWIVAWLFENERIVQAELGHYTEPVTLRVEQNPHIRVTLGALLQITSDAAGVHAIVQVDPSSSFAGAGGRQFGFRFYPVK